MLALVHLNEKLRFNFSFISLQVSYLGFNSLIFRSTKRFVTPFLSIGSEVTSFFNFLNFAFCRCYYIPSRDFDIQFKTFIGPKMENPTVRPTTTGGKSVYSIQRAKTILIGSTTLRTKFIIRVTNPMLFPLSCILSRQPARTTLRFAPSPPLRFGPAGVRSGTQPTVIVAKGK